MILVVVLILIYIVNINVEFILNVVDFVVDNLSNLLVYLDVDIYIVYWIVV